jgi:hypothetical protein
VIDKGVLKITLIEKSTPPDAEALAARLYAMLPRIRITDLPNCGLCWSLEGVDSHPCALGTKEYKVSCGGHGMKNSTLFERLVVYFVALGIQCLVLASPLAGAFADSLTITPVDPLPRPAGNDLTADSPVPLKLALNYVLTSTDRARLSVFAEQFPYTAGGCTGPVHMTNGGSDILIQRGPGARQLTIIWRGNMTVRQIGYQKGYVTVGVNLWTIDGRKISGELFPSLCYHFFSGGQRID